MTANGQVVVIGGGIIGTACAYFLSGQGWKVTLIDRGEFGQGCSHANCGFVCPSHVLPLAGPGAVGKTFKALLAKDSPFYIKPRLDLAMWSWLWNFARRCNSRDMLRAGQAIAALLNSSRALYEQLLACESLDCEWQARGLLFVFQTARGLEEHSHTQSLLQETFHVEATPFDSKEINALEPALKPGLAGGFLYKNDAHLRPDKLLSAWRTVLESRGVIIREHCDLVDFEKEHGRARKIVTSQSPLTPALSPKPGERGELAADAFVIATGAWTPLLNRQLGCRIPIQPGKGYSITMGRPARCPVHPLMFEEHRVAVTPMASGYRLGSTMEFAGYDATLNPRRLDYLKRAAGIYLQEPLGEPVLEEWFGWRPMTHDSLPIIDRSPIMNNVLIAAGHNMLGLSMAPATGKLVAEILTGQPPHLDPLPYSLARF